MQCNLVSPTFQMCNLPSFLLRLWNIPVRWPRAADIEFHGMYDIDSIRLLPVRLPVPHVKGLTCIFGVTI